MTRRVVALTPDRLADLGLAGLPCRGCLRWELDPVRRARVPPEETAAEKQVWLSEVLREWGSCGRVVLVDDVPVAWTLYAPAAFVPGAQAHPTAPISPDAVLLVTAWVHPEHTGNGLGRLLVQGMARDLVERGGIRAVEAFASTRPDGGGCRLPAGFLAHVGFRTVRPHPVTPRLRMDLRGALSWRDELEAALDRLRGVVRPSRRPAPALGRAERVDPS